MKVKNVMFAGFAAAILSGVCGAAEAAEAKILASKGFVETEIGKLDQKKQDVIEGLDAIKAGAAKGETAVQPDEISDMLTQTDAAATYATKSYVGTIPEGVDADNVVAYVEKKTEGIATEGAMTTLSGRVGSVETKVTTLEGDANTEGSVAYDIAQAISGEVLRADAAYAEKELETTVSDLATNVADNYVSNTALEQKGYQTRANVQAEIAGATIQQSQVSGLADTLAGYVDDTTFTTYQGTVTEALDTKAAAGDVQTLQQTVAGFTNAESGIAATYATKTELSGVEAIAEAALPESEFNTFKTTVNAEAIAEAKKAGTDATDALDAYKEQMTTALAGKQATIDNLATIEAGAAKGATAVQANAAITAGTAAKITYDEKGLVTAGEPLSASDIPTIEQSQVSGLTAALDGKQAAGDYLKEMTENGSYLVTKTTEGVDYTAVQVVSSDGTTDLLTGSLLVTE